MLGECPEYGRTIRVNGRNIQSIKPLTSASQTACQKELIMRSFCPAPSNCEINVFAYRTVPIGTQTMVQCSMEAGVTAASASSEQPARRILSAAFINDCDPALSISGKATRVSSFRLLKRSSDMSGWGLSSPGMKTVYVMSFEVQDTSAE